MNTPEERHTKAKLSAVVVQFLPCFVAITQVLASTGFWLTTKSHVFVCTHILVKKSHVLLIAFKSLALAFQNPFLGL